MSISAVGPANRSTQVSNRVGRGVPSGGQFSATGRTEPAVHLGADCPVKGPGGPGNPLTARQIESKGNSTVLQIEAIVGRRAMPGPRRMVKVAELTDSYRRAVSGAVDDPYRGDPYGVQPPVYPGGMERHPIAPHQVTSNANSKVLQIEAIVDDRAMPAPEQMVRITALVDSFRDAVRGSTHDPFRETR